MSHTDLPRGEHMKARAELTTQNPHGSLFCPSLPFLGFAVSSFVFPGLRSVKLYFWFSFGPNVVRPRPMVKLRDEKQSLAPSAHAHEAHNASTRRSARCSANGYELRIKGGRKTGRHGGCVAFVPETLIGSGG